jgi:hypothetical protein
MKGSWLLNEYFTSVRKVQIGHEFVADSNIISPFCLGAFFHWVLLK